MFAQDTTADTIQDNVVMTMLSNLFLPSFDHISEIRRKQVGAVSMATWTKENGFPQTLPETPVDRFWGKALGYHRECDNGFVIYSIGPNGEVVFRYPLPLVATTDLN